MISVTSEASPRKAGVKNDIYEADHEAPVALDGIFATTNNTIMTAPGIDSMNGHVAEEHEKYLNIAISAARPTTNQGVPRLPELSHEELLEHHDNIDVTKPVEMLKRQEQSIKLSTGRSDLGQNFSKTDDVDALADNDVFQEAKLAALQSAEALPTQVRERVHSAVNFAKHFIGYPRRPKSRMAASLLQRPVKPFLRSLSVLRSHLLPLLLV